ncbi:DUF3265 domain-containing protein, partial [Vibrio vulnificus]|nr:DUF3265 domain-containing protein [Vibrio vulnificus]
AFLVCGGFGGESGLRKVGLGGIHPLTQRYAYTREGRVWMNFLIK